MIRLLVHTNHEGVIQPPGTMIRLLSRDQELQWIAAGAAEDLEKPKAANAKGKEGE